MAKPSAKNKEQPRDTLTRDTYDDKPYPSYPYPLSQPEHIAAVATWLGVHPVPLEKARILELGCAGGGNLFPSAVKYPGSTCLGIDLSPVQIDEALKHTRAMGLTNAEFKALDIMDFDKSYGEFDYIICHGVFSWVPEFVREKIMQICRDNLSPRGVAMITFNTLPGWASLGAIRDMMKMHTRHTSDNTKKIAQAKTLLSFLYKFMPEKTNLRGAVVQAMETFSRANNDSYILHEYLEPNNKPFFFEEFHDYLPPHRLRYLGDSVLNKMFAGNLGADIDGIIRQIVDPIKREQYMDFISNRQFRWALIGRDTQPEPRPIDDAALQKLFFNTQVAPVTEKSDPQQGRFIYAIPGVGIDYESLSPVMTAIIETLIAAGGRALSLADITDVVRSIGFDDAALATLNKTLMLLCYQSVVDIHITPSPFVTAASAAPKAFDLARYQASLPDCTWVTSMENQTTNVTPEEAALLKTLDGSPRAHHEILESLCRKKLLAS